jgi:hypothetical protein
MPGAGCSGSGVTRRRLRRLALVPRHPVKKEHLARDSPSGAVFGPGAGQDADLDAQSEGGGGGRSRGFTRRSVACVGPTDDPRSRGRRLIR